MYLHINEPDILSKIYTGEVRQVTMKPLFNDTPKDSIGGAETFLIHSGDVLKTCFGKVTITAVVFYQGLRKFENFDDLILGCWAKEEGFDSFEEADRAFSDAYGPDWIHQEMMCFRFLGEWVNDD